MDLVSIFRDFIFFPIIESFNAFAQSCIAYSQFSLNGENWGFVGVQNYFIEMVPSFFMENRRVFAREYYSRFAEVALAYDTEYSPLTFHFPTELILSFGLQGLSFGMFFLGFLMKMLYNYLNKRTSPLILRLFYLGFISTFSFGFNFGFLTTDVVTPLRFLSYLMFILFIYKGFKFKKKVSKTKIINSEI